MRTSFTTIASYGLVAAASLRTATAIAFPDPAAFLDSSSSNNNLLQARAVLPNVVGLHPRHYHDFSHLSKRGPENRDVDSPDDCGDDEEFVPYQQHAVEPSKPAAAESKAEAAPVLAEAGEQDKQEQKQQEEVPTTTSATPEATPITPVGIPNNNSAAALQTPDNIAEGSYTVEEGCVRYYEPVAGDICLSVVEANKDAGLTLDQLYCLNPAIDDMCYNLWIGTSYCVAYGGEEPLNTGVSTRR